MFISEEEMRARLKSTDNLLTRLGISSSEPHSNPEISNSNETQKEQTDETIFEINRTTTPTFSSDGDPERLSTLSSRRATKDSDERGGRYPKQGNIPPISRSLIGSAARLGTVRHTAQTFGVSTVLTNNYKHGKVHQDDEPRPSLLSKIDQDTLEIRNQVLGVLAFTVAGITPESLENKDPKELSIIARNLSSIMSSTKPIEVQDKSTNAQVIVFSPEQNTKDGYDTIEIG